MKKFAGLSLALLILFSVSAAGADEKKASAVKSGVKALVSDTVSAGKDIMSGISEGVDEGRKETESTDGARVAASKKDIESLSLTFNITKVEFLAEDKSRVQLTVALNNPNDFPVRLTNLNEARNVVLLDDEGFSYPLEKSVVQGRDVTALGRSATRLRFIFSDLEAKPDVFRFFDRDFKLDSANKS